MKTQLTLFAIVALFFAGTYSSIGQDDAKQREQYAKEKRQLAESQRPETNKTELTEEQRDEMKPESIAKKQSEDLKQLLTLDEKQTARIYELCLAVKMKISDMPADLDADKKADQLNDLEKAKIDKMKEALTEEQFKIYLNSLHMEKK